MGTGNDIRTGKKIHAGESFGAKRQTAAGGNHAGRQFRSVRPPAVAGKNADRRWKVFDFPEKDVGIRTRLPAGGMLGSVLQNLALRLAKNEELSKKKGFLHFSLTIFLYICCNETELF